MNRRTLRTTLAHTLQFTNLICLANCQLKQPLTLSLLDAQQVINHHDHLFHWDLHIEVLPSPFHRDMATTIIGMLCETE
jgi:hypothetical protein